MQRLFTSNRSALQSVVRPLLLMSLLIVCHVSDAAVLQEDLLNVEPVRIIEGGGKLGLRHPSDVRMSSDGHVLVLDGVANRIAVYDHEGRFQHSFGTGGSGEGELDYPLGMTLDADDNIYIADSGNARVQIFSIEGKYIGRIDITQDAKGKRPDPTDVILDEARKLLYIVDNENHKVLVYSLKDKKFIHTIGNMSHTEGGFRWPFSLAIDDKGVVYIVDVINTRVRTILPDEGFRLGGDIGAWGVEKGELFRPKGVAIDDKGRVFISDSYLGVIQMFSKAGRFLAVLGDGAGSVQRFTTPTRLYFDKNGLFYVVEMFANRISVYRIKS